MTPFTNSRPLFTQSEGKLLEEIDLAIRTAAALELVTDQVYPTLIDRNGLEQAGYREAFPQLLFNVTSSGIGSIPDADRSEWCLSPAVCYHTFLSLAGSRSTSEVKITARNRCYRNEEEPVTGRRHIEFEMRELIFIGGPSWLEEQLVHWQQKIDQIANDFGIHGHWQSASDPFFLPLSKGRALMQRLLNLKKEYCLDDGLAIASINRHGSYFAQRFSIEIAPTALTHSACVAFGLDRWVWAATYSTVK